MNAASLISASTGFYISQTKDGNEISSVDRGERVFLFGPFSNTSGKTLNISLGVEFKDIVTGESFFKKLCSEDSWVENYSLVYISFYTDFMINNSIYEISPIYIESGKDDSVLENWDYISLPEEFKSPTLQITGDILPAYFSVPPFVGTEKNVAEIDDTQMYMSISLQQEIKNAELFAFVFKDGEESSIGYYRINIDQQNGSTKEYTAKYQPSGSKSTPLEIGQVYELSFRFFINKREVSFDSRYDLMTFKVVDNGTDIKMIQDTFNYSPVLHKIINPNGQIEILSGGKSFSILGNQK